MAEIRVPSHTGVAPHQYIHYNWANYRRNVSRQAQLLSTPVEDVYSRWADKAANEFRSKFKIDPEMADFYHDAIKDIYGDATFFNESMMRVVRNLDKDIKQASAGMKKSQTIQQVLNRKTSSSNAKKQVKAYITALQQFITAINSIDSTIVKAKVDGKSKNIGVRGGAVTLLKNNATAFNAYINLQSSVKALDRAMKDIKKGKSVDIIKFDKYKAALDDAGRLMAVLQTGKGEGAIPAEKIISSIEASLSHIMGEFMENAMIDTLKSGLNELFTDLQTTGTRTGGNGRKYQTDVKVGMGDSVEIGIGIKPGPKGSKTTMHSSTVGQLLSAWGETGVGNDDIYEFLLMNAVAHSFLGHNGFSKEDYQVNKLMRLMAAQAANFAIGNSTDYIFYSDGVYSKYELMKGMSAAQKNFKRLIFTLGSSDINKAAVDELYKSGIMARLNYLRPRVLAVKLKIESK